VTVQSAPVPADANVDDVWKSYAINSSEVVAPVF
jgi:hypothetical protein